MGGHPVRIVGKQLAVIAVGLGLGATAIALLDRRDTPSYRTHDPSVSAFAFPTSVPEGPPPTAEVVPTLATEPADARAAVAAFLQPLVDGQPGLAHPLLDEDSRRRYPTTAAWIHAQADRATPVTYTLGAARPSPDHPGAVEVDVAATHTPSLDATRGLVPGRSTSSWLVRLEAGVWRVAADPLVFRPVLPADAAATDAVQGWVSSLAACDSPGATLLQVGPNLYGPENLAQAPCQTRGTWTAGAPVGFDRTPDPRQFLAAFGPEVGAWARLVPVQGPDTRFLAAVAPMGDDWRVMGVAVDGR